MSALLLDTHVWLWYSSGNAERLRTAQVKKLDAARNNDGLVVSAISVWEVAMLSVRGRIQLAVPLRDWVETACRVPGIGLVPLDADAATESALLPGVLHGDPADRFLIATARTKGCVLATHDEQIVAYAKLGFIRVLAL